MRSIVLRPRWLILSVVVALVVALFIALGFWQLQRLDERRLNNAILATRLNRPPVSLEEVESSGLPASELEFTVVTATGELDPGRSVFVRSQVHDGQAGTHQVAPLLLDDGTAVLINLGWVPLNTFPKDAPGLGGMVEVVGFIRASERQPRLGGTEPEGVLREVRRIDVERIEQQLPYELRPYWIQLIQPDHPGPPYPAPPPVLDEGTHLAYALQWFSFAAISVIGFVFLVRREARRGGTAVAGGSYVVDDDEGT